MSDVPLITPLAPEGEPLPPPNPETRAPYNDAHARQAGKIALGSSEFAVVAVDNNHDVVHAQTKRRIGEEFRIKDFREAGYPLPLEDVQPDYNDVVLAIDPNTGNTVVVSRGHRVKDDTPPEAQRKTPLTEIKQLHYGPKMSEPDPSSNRTAVDEIHEQLLRLHDPSVTSAELHLFNLVGIRRDESRNAATIPSSFNLNTHLKRIAQETGYAPEFLNIDARVFSSVEGIKALADRKILLSGMPESRIHDILTHVPGWVALPAETFEVIVANAQRLLKDYLDAGSPDKEAKHPARKAIERYFAQNMEEISGTLIRDEATGIVDPKDSLVYILFPQSGGQHNLTPDEKVLLDHHFDLLQKRKHDLAALTT